MPFNYRRYNAADPQLSSPHSDAYANKGFVISFYHMISATNLRFKAYLTSLNETYTPDYNSESVFGRADQIHTYKNTTRNITLAFKIPAESMGEAYENLAKTQALIQMLYPAYIDVNSATTVAQAPLVRLKVMNIIRKNIGGSSSTIPASPQDLYDSYSSEDDVLLGLLGVIQNVTVQHNLENDEIGVLEKKNNTLLPKLIEVNLDFKPLHEHTIGWIDGNNFTEPSFPYGATLYDNLGASSDVTYPTQQLEDNQAAVDEAEAAKNISEGLDKVGKSISGPYGKSRTSDDKRSTGTYNRNRVRERGR